MIYAVGDIHGELAILEELLDELRWDAHNHASDNHKLIFIGDYVDRGPHSRQVIDTIKNGVDGFETTFLKGNHEYVFLDFIKEPTPEKAERWFRDFVGGKETLASYDIDADAVHEDLKNGDDVSRHLGAVPKDHLEFLEKLTLTHEEPGYYFTHAGIRPGVDLRDQEEKDLLWVRETFLEDERDHGPIVVHGHSTRRDVELLHNRINIDTGACLFGVLSAVALEKVGPRVIQVKGRRQAKYPPHHVTDVHAAD